MRVIQVDNILILSPYHTWYRGTSRSSRTDHQTQLHPCDYLGHIVNENERDLLLLPPRLGCLGIRILTEALPIEFTNSMNLNKSLQNEIKRTQTDSTQMTIQQVKNERRTKQKDKLSIIQVKMTKTVE